MKRLLISIMASLVLGQGAVSMATPQDIVIISGTVDTPQIDAITVVNNGTFYAETPGFPYETSDTLNYTNNGNMQGNSGWLFDTSPSGSGVRRPAANFFNNNTVVGTNFLIIQATNIFNSGLFQVGALGVMNLSGENVTLAQSILNVQAVQPSQPDLVVTMTNHFAPDTAIYDLYWAQTNFDANYQLLSGAIWDGANASAQFVNSPPAGPGPIPPFTIGGVLSDSYTTNLGSSSVTPTNSQGNPGTPVIIVTNMTKGAVFVKAPPTFKTQIRFTKGPNNFNIINVLLAAPLTNGFNKNLTTNYVYFRDTLASYGSLGLLLNDRTLSTYRPSNYLVNRFPHDNIFVTNYVVVFSNNVPVKTNAIAPEGFFGAGKPSTNFLITSGNASPQIGSDLVSNSVVQAGSFAAYSAFLDNVASRPPPVAGGTITNLPGSIFITAKNLDLSQVQLNAEGQISISAENLISSSEAQVECENLNYNLGTPRQNLTITNLTFPDVGRMRGSIQAWSAFWTNTVYVVIPTNYVMDTSSGSTNWVLTPLTNNVNVGYDVLVLDASGLVNTLTVSLYTLMMHGNHIELDDNMTVLQSLLVDGLSFTVNGSITLPGFFPPANPINNVVFPGVALQNWIGTNAPDVQFFTNNGSISIDNEAHFGDDRPPYTDFVNNGFIAASSFQLSSAYFENAGQIFAAIGSIIMQSDRSWLHDGFNVSSSGFAQFTANSLVISNYQLFAGDSLTFNVTDVLTDGGPASGNLIEVQNGFNLLNKPTSGDLLGTTVFDTAVKSNQVQLIHHTWAGENRGANPAGYVNNVALGTLALSAANPQTKFVFSGTGSNNGLYVDVLDLTALGSNSVSVLNELQINPNIVVYYAAARLGFTPPLTNGVPQQPEEFLNNKFGGRLRWVSSYAGPNSSVNTVIGGHPVTINSGLANSQVTPPAAAGVALMTVTVNGNGTLQPNDNGQYLVLNQTYAMIAQPAPGSTFLGWTGSVTTASPQVTFVMQSNLNLVATFSFAPTVGSYTGLFYETNGVEFGKSGFVTISTTKTGKYTGSLQLSARKFSFSGQLNANGADAIAIPNSGLSLALLAGTDRITGAVSSNSAWTAPLLADRAVFNSKTNKASFAGKFTIVFPGSDIAGDTNSPQGDGIGTINVSATGGVQLQATLADGTKVSQTATASGDGLWPLYIPLYNGQGQILSWQTFANTSDADVSGMFSWIKQPKPGDKFYPGGFTFQTNAVGSAYDSTLAPVTGFTDAALLLSGGNLSADLLNTVTISTKNKITSTSGGKLNMTLTPPQGLFKGNVMNPATGKSQSFNGVILQKQGAGFGYFLGTNLSGHVSFAP